MFCRAGRYNRRWGNPKASWEAQDETLDWMLLAYRDRDCHGRRAAGRVAFALAQGTDGVVPDLTGMNVPAAAAALNRLGLALGTETGVAWSEGAAGAPNTIIGQSVPAGQPVTPGAAVDIIVARELNALLIYTTKTMT